MPHDALQIPEVLDLIFRHVLPDPDNLLITSSVVHRNLVALALTCRLFSDIALDILWNTQQDPKKIMRLIPRLNPSTSRKSIERYTHRIRFLTFTDSEWEDAERALDYLHDSSSPFPLPGSRSLFPNIRTLHMSALKPKWEPPAALQMLVTNHLTRLIIDWDDGLPGKDSDSAALLLDLIREKHASLEVLRLGDISANQPAYPSTWLSSLLMKMPTLRVLACGWRALHIDTIGKLGTYDNLVVLELPNMVEDLLKSASNSMNPYQGTQLFPSLRRLRVRVEYMSPVAHFIECVQLKGLTELVLDCYKPSKWVDMHVLFTQLATCQRLHTLHLNHEWKDPVILQELVVDTLTLTPLLSLPEMRNLTLNLACSFDLDNTFIQRAALAWPRLQKLQLGSFLGWKRRSDITLDGLIPLAANCPGLEKLTLSINASSPRISDFSEIVPNLLLKSFHVTDSLCGYSRSKETFLFLKKIFPNLRSIDGAWLYGAGQLGAADYVKWMQVRQHLDESEKHVVGIAC